MRGSLFVVQIIGALLSTGAANAQAISTDDVQKIADTMVRLCVGGGSLQTISGGASGGANVSIRSLDVTGNLSGQFNISRSAAEGLTAGIDNALTQVAASEADKVRDCLAPVRVALLQAMLPPQQPSRPPRTFSVCAGNGGGPSCQGWSDVYYTCDQYTAIGGGSQQTYTELGNSLCKFTDSSGHEKIGYSSVIHLSSVGGGQCGWTRFSVTCTYP
jgi:hypothetical protein